MIEFEGLSISNLSTEKIAYILHSRSVILKSIKRRKKALMEEYQELEEDLNKDEEICSISLKGSPLKDTIISPTNNRTDPLYQIIKTYDENKKRRQHEIIENVHNLINYENVINKIWAAFNNLESPTYEVIGEQVIKNAKYDTIQLELGLSRKKISEEKIKGLEKIKRIIEKERIKL